MQNAKFNFVFWFFSFLFLVFGGILFFREFFQNTVVQDALNLYQFVQ
jgi:hypothetical protein